MVAAGFRAGLLALVCAGCTSIAADARTFEGTRWHVTAINGRATPQNVRYHIDFRNGGVSGMIGCNSFGGRYAAAKDVLSFPQLNSTLMACAGGPGMAFESAGFAVMQRPMRMRWLNSQRLTLTNASGAIALELMR